jgi:phosphohistidine phosphatase
MHLYLVQHGEAKSKEDDPERPLTERGKLLVQKVARFLRPSGLKVKAVWHSGKTRAQQTAEILVSALTSDQGIVARDGLAPNDPVGPVREAIEQSDGDLMVVGHLPFLSRLAASLLTGSEQNEVVSFQYGTVVALTAREDGSWAIGWMIAPGLLGAS